MSDQTTMSPRDYDIGTEPLGAASRQRSQALATRLEQGARALAALASTLTSAEWERRIPTDGRKIGVVVHHVASMYPIEMQLALTLAAGRPVKGLAWAYVHALNRKHASEHDVVTK